MLILLILSTETEAKELLNDEVITLLVGYLGKCVRKELPTPNLMWVDERCTMIIRTLEKMIISDKHIVAKLFEQNLLTFLGMVLEEAVCFNESQRDNELSATLKCLWSVSQDAEALLQISNDASLVKGMLSL